MTLKQITQNESLFTICAPSPTPVFHKVTTTANGLGSYKRSLLCEVYNGNIQL